MYVVLLGRVTSHRGACYLNSLRQSRQTTGNPLIGRCSYTCFLLVRTWGNAKGHERQERTRGAWRKCTVHLCNGMYICLPVGNLYRILNLYREWRGVFYTGCNKHLTEDLHKSYTKLQRWSTSRGFEFHWNVMWSWFKLYWEHHIGLLVYSYAWQHWGPWFKSLHGE